MAVPITSTAGTVHWNNAEIDQARGWTINISGESKTYATNKTEGNVSRRPGNRDFTGSFTVYSVGAALVAYPMQIANLKLYINGTSYWNFDKAIIESVDYEVNVETNDIEAVTYNWAFAGNVDGTGGTVTAPDATVLTTSNVGEIAEA